MSDVSGIFVAQGEHPLHLLLRLANRHGLVAGATGTGKTVTLQVMAEFGVGEALVSFLEASGSPAVVERAKVRPPQSRLGSVTPEERATTIAKSPIGPAYDQLVDRESAFERLTARAETAAAAATKAPRPTISPGRARESAGEAMLKSVVRSVGTQLGRQIVRGLLGSILRR